MSGDLSSAGEIITFYSYKGGAGRSMALANVACLLAKKLSSDEKILMIDWDLEAPGLHEFFHGQFNLAPGRPGLIDLFYEIRTRLQNNYTEDDLPTKFFDDLKLEEYVVNTNIPNIPSLFIMPAGRFDDRYSLRVNAFDWADFFNNYPSVITQFAHYLRQKYRYTLIDSRTGYTDISGICTALMPEKLVVAFTPNHQNINGSVEIIRRAIDYRKQSDDLRPLVMFPLASRIDPSDDLKEWRPRYQKQFESALKDAYDLENCNLTEYFDDVQIQYLRKYSYGEAIAVLSERVEDTLSLAHRFAKFVEKLTDSKNPWEWKESGKTYKLPETEPTLEVSRRKIVFLIVFIVILLGFVGSIISGSFLLAPLLWLFGGIVLDVLKLVLATLGNSAAQATEALKKISHEGRIEILKANPGRTESEAVKEIAKVFGQIKCSLLSWSTNFLRQVVEPEDETDTTDIGHAIASQLSKPNRDAASYLMPCEDNIKSIFDSPENKYAGQQIIGALFGFLALLAFLYADAAQGAQTFTLLFKGTIPPFLNSIIIPLVTASAGSALLLGVFIGDILGLTHLGLFRQDTPKPFLWVISINLFLSLSLSTLIALTRMELLGTENQVVKTIVNISQSLVILPMLVTTFLLFRSLSSGLYVALSLTSSLLSVPFGVFEFFLRILSDLLRSGLIGGSFLITRIIGLTVAALEIVFFLLELALRGGFAVLINLVTVVFFIPYLLLTIILRVTRQEEFYRGFLKDLLSSPLQTKLDDSIVTTRIVQQ